MAGGVADVRGTGVGKPIACQHDGKEFCIRFHDLQPLGNVNPVVGAIANAHFNALSKSPNHYQLFIDLCAIYFPTMPSTNEVGSEKRSAANTHRTSFARPVEETA
jgi:hypothetical protein